MFSLGFRKAEKEYEPLDEVELLFHGGELVKVFDGNGRLYVQTNVEGKSSYIFLAGGAIGIQKVDLCNAQGTPIDSVEFVLKANTSISDNTGIFDEFTKVLKDTMNCYAPDGLCHLSFKDKEYGFYVPWILDHIHTAKGMQFFSSHERDLVDLFSLEQNTNGMIWSNVFEKTPVNYIDSNYGEKFSRRYGEIVFSRQPVENHCEYNFVNCMYLSWKASGDDEWLKGVVDSAVRALNYSVSDNLRWSKKYNLLKRAYCIDSWDFQIEDEFLPDTGVNNTMLIDEKLTKFGVFFGDNTGYASACKELSLMLAHLERKAEADVFEKRSHEIMDSLNKLAWNGRYYTHRIEEDETVKRNLGVDESTQIAMSNCYSINREMTHDQCKAVLETYLDLKNNLPTGSPGEWYSIYPPFESGLGHHSDKWDYMNAGVHGHAAGELALGAFKHGYETYGADILKRLLQLAKDTNGLVSFAYTGAFIEPEIKQEFRTIDLQAYANMSLSINRDETKHSLQSPHGSYSWMCETEEENHFQNCPRGLQNLQGVPFNIASGDKVVIATGENKKIQEPSISVPVGEKAGAIYLLHTFNNLGASGVAGAVKISYSDGTQLTQYMLNEKHISGWWYPESKSELNKIAWEGTNDLCKRLGLTWYVLQNPNPEKTIETLTFCGSAEGSIYSVFAVTLADRMPYVKKSLVSFGGPDNWAGGTCMLALVEGLAGVENLSTKMDSVRLSPRWGAAECSDASVVARFGASNGYLAYNYKSYVKASSHDSKNQEHSNIRITVTGSGNSCLCNVLLPNNKVEKVLVNGMEVKHLINRIENSYYCEFYINLDVVKEIEIQGLQQLYSNPKH